MSSDEEDVAVPILWFLLREIEQEENKKKLWVHPLNLKRTENNTIKCFIQELRNDECKFRNFTRMSTDTFDYILEILNDEIRKPDTNFRKSITPEEKLLVTLSYLATGERFQRLHYQFRLGATTIGLITNEVCTAIWKLLSPIYLPTPREEDWIKISNEFDKIWNFPNCTGAIDGKHIAIQCPPCAGSEYFNYKGFHSIVLQAVVDAHAKFITIDVGDYGRSSDSGIFKESNFGKMLLHNELNLPPPRKIHNDINEEYPFVFVGDEAYPLLPYLMRPFPRRNLTNEKRIFNYRQSRARRIVECAFGIMVKKFKVLENKIVVGPEKATQIVKAICVLHNLIMTREQHCIDIQEFINSQEQNEIIEQDISRIRSSNNRSSTAAISLRNKFTEYFNSNKGSVSWQNKYTVY